MSRLINAKTRPVAARLEFMGMTIALGMLGANAVDSMFIGGTGLVANIAGGGVGAICGYFARL
jgi:hypothetical protein